MHKTMKDVINNNPGMNLDNFGDIINKFLTDIDYTMLLHMPKGTQDVKITDNVEGGAVIWLYALIAGLVPTLKGLTGTILDREKLNDVLDNILDMVKREVKDGLDGQ